MLLLKIEERKYIKGILKSTEILIFCGVLGPENVNKFNLFLRNKLL